jgi:hypothetical protein
MKRPRSFLLSLAAVATVLASAQALAVGRIADVSVVDRDSGQVIEARYHRGEWWVEGRPGARYAIRVRNTLGQRVLAVTSVDGVNVVTGETAALDQRGYIFDAWAGYDVTGWRKSDAQIAAFEFTSVPRSYAARTGRPDNVGVIGVALFRERTPQPVARAEVSRATPLAAEEEASADASANSATKAESRESSQRLAQAQPAPALGTGHGRREDSYVTQVAFERARARPDEMIRLRYDSRSNLVAMGVIREAQPPRRPEAFPAGPQLGYVPDP